MEPNEIERLLSRDPFTQDGPTEYEEYLYGVIKLAWANIAALTAQVERLNAHIKEHERLHAASNAAALKVPTIEPDKNEKPN